LSGWNDLLPKTQLNLSGKKANDGFSVLCIREAVAGTVACVWIDPTISLNSVWATCSVTVVNGRGGSLDFTLEKELLLKFGKDIYWTWLLQYTTKGDGIPVLDVAVCNDIVTNAKNVSFCSSSSGMTSLAGHSLSVPETAWSFPCDMDSDALVFHILGWEKDNPGSCECKTIAPEKSPYPVYQSYPPQQTRGSLSCSKRIAPHRPQLTLAATSLSAGMVKT